MTMTMRMMIGTREIHCVHSVTEILGTMGSMPSDDPTASCISLRSSRTVRAS